MEKGYTVHGLVRRTSTPSTSRVSHLLANPKLVIHTGDMSDQASLDNAVMRSMPDEIYNFAAQSDVHASYKCPAYTADVTGIGFARLLESVRKHCAQARVYQACSSEMFGKVQQTPQTETTPFYPRSPYGCAKAFTYYLGRSYRESYGLQISHGILFNHESNRRGMNFLSRHVASTVARIKAGLTDHIEVGNLDAKRDMGYAKEYVEWIWKILQHDEPDDFLIATGETHSVREFIELAFQRVGLDWEKYVRIDPARKRPAEVDLLLGDASKSRRVLGFEAKVKFAELVNIMVDAEMEALNVQA